jgi:hypothetical protein
MPVLARRRYEIGEPVEELKRRELDDAIRSRPPPESREKPHASVDFIRAAPARIILENHRRSWFFHYGSGMASMDALISGDLAATPP